MWALSCNGFTNLERIRLFVAQPCKNDIITMFPFCYNKKKNLVKVLQQQAIRHAPHVSRGPSSSTECRDFIANLHQNIMQWNGSFCHLAVLWCSCISVELYRVWLILCSTRRESAWSSAASDVNPTHPHSLLRLGIFPKTCAQAHADKHCPSPSDWKCWHVCWLWFSASACFSSRPAQGQRKKRKREATESCLIWLWCCLSPPLPFVSHISPWWLHGLSE